LKEWRVTSLGKGGVGKNVAEVGAHNETFVIG